MNDSEDMIRKLQREVESIEKLKKRARDVWHVGVLMAPSRLGGSGTASVRKGRLFHTRNTRQEPSEIILTDIERAEFAEWCEQKSEQLKQEAEERELKLAQGGIS